VKTIHAQVNIGNSDGTYQKVTVEAESIEDAMVTFYGKYGIENVYSIYEEIQLINLDSIEEL
jgi:hypothetical protein